MQRVHLDTDIGGDIDDLCALAMLLRWPDVEITGITTVAEASGRRAGYVRTALALEDREDIPVAAGADVADGYYRYPELGYPEEERYWSQPTTPAPNEPGDALDLLECSISLGASIIAIGPFTNLRLLEERHPGILVQSELTLMGGYVYPIRSGYPKWDNEDDWNIQVDTTSAYHVLLHARPTLVPLTVTVETALRRAYLEELRQAGELGNLIARQAEAFAIDEANESRFGETCPGLPLDIINFQHDSLACAIALGWREGVSMEEVGLRVELRDGILIESAVKERTNGSHRFVSPEVDRKSTAPDTTVRLVTRIDGPRFDEFWLRQVTAM
ncbi:MAG: nucleoside hydrolase [Caldilineaceae bacterium]